MDFITNPIWRTSPSFSLGQGNKSQVMKFQIMKALPLDFYWPDGFCYRICNCFWEETYCLRKKKKKNYLPVIIVPSAATDCWFIRAPRCCSYCRTSPGLLWGNCETSGQLQRNQWGLEGWTLLTRGVPMNIFRLKELTVQKSNSLISPKGKYKQMAPLKKKISPMDFQHLHFILYVEQMLLWRLKRNTHTQPRFGYCGICRGQRAFFCRKSWLVIESHFTKLMPWV